MDTYRDHPSDFELPASNEPHSPQDVAAAIGTDERRMHVRAYNYWVSLLEGRDFPSIEDLEPADLQDFAANSVLLDFTCGRDDPALPYVGAAVREECGLDDDTRSISSVPSRSLLSRLTDHYLQIIANRAPVGFEAEYENIDGQSICYRGILMPFSSDGDTIDFIYGVINWKQVAGNAAAGAIAAQLPPLADPVVEQAVEAEATLELAESPEPDPVEILEAVEPHVLQLDEPVPFDPPPVESETHIEVPTGIESPETASDPAPVHPTWEDGPLGDEIAIELPEIALDDSAALADRLWAARETAETVKAGEGRTRAALYHALSLAYDFAVAAHADPDEYAELLEESGVKLQARAPMTPIVKLVFGIDYDKARLTEFAAALSYAQRQQIALGAFQDFIEQQPGGLKALVAAERQARRPQGQRDSNSDAARARLRAAPPISLADLPVEEEFAVVITRRGADGLHEPVAIVDDEALRERAIRRAN